MDFVDADGGASPSASLAMRYLHGPAVDQVLAQETAGNTVRWMLADHQGTIRDPVDNAGALAGDHIVFDPFGRITSGTPETRFTYTGQEYDPDTGLYYYNARWYDPRTGRFVTKDPTGFAAGDTNQYRYVGNNAANFRDPSGHSVLGDYAERAFMPWRDPPPKDWIDSTLHYGKYVGWGMACVGGGLAVGAEALGIGGITVGGSGAAGGVSVTAGAGTTVGGVLDDAADGVIGAADDAAGGGINPGVDLPVPPEEAGMDFPLAGGPEPKVLQSGGHTINERTRKALGLSREQMKNAIEGLKECIGQGSKDHAHKILDNGDILDANTNRLLGNLFDYLN